MNKFITLILLLTLTSLISGAEAVPSAKLPTTDPRPVQTKLLSLYDDPQALGNEYNKVVQKGMPLDLRVDCFALAFNRLMTLKNLPRAEQEYISLLSSIPQNDEERTKLQNTEFYRFGESSDSDNLPKLRTRLRYFWVTKLAELYLNDPNSAKMLGSGNNCPERTKLEGEVADIVMDQQCSEDLRLHLATTSLVNPGNAARQRDELKKVIGFLDTGKWSPEGRTKLVVYVVRRMIYSALPDFEAAAERINHELALAEKQKYRDSLKFSLMLLQLDLAERRPLPGAAEEQLALKFENDYRLDQLCDKINALPELTAEERDQLKLRQAEYCAPYDLDRAVRLYMEVISEPRLDNVHVPPNIVTNYLELYERYEDYSRIAEQICKIFCSFDSDITYQESVIDYARILKKLSRPERLEELVLAGKKIVPEEDFELFRDDARKSFAAESENPFLPEILVNFNQAADKFRTKYPQAWKNPLLSAVTK